MANQNIATGGNSTLQDVFERLADRLEQMEVDVPRGPKRDIKVYTGKPHENLIEWFKDYELKFRRKPRLRADRFPDFLDGLARQFYLSLPRETQEDWSLLQESFSKRFIPPDMVALYASALANHKQGKYEGVGEFATESNRLVDCAYPNIPPEHRETLYRSNFVNGLLPDIKNHVDLHAKTTSYGDAFSAAVKYEMKRNVDTQNISSKSGQGLNNKESPGIYAGFKMMARREEGDTRPRVNMATRSRGNPRGRSHQRFKFTSDGRPICTICESVGHMARDCELNDQTTNAQGFYQHTRSSSTYPARGTSSSRGMRHTPDRGRHQSSNWRGHSSSRGRRESSSRGRPYQRHRVHYLGSQGYEDQNSKYYEEDDQAEEGDYNETEEDSELFQLKNEIAELKEQNRRYKEKENTSSVSYLRASSKMSSMLSLTIISIMLLIFSGGVHMTEALRDINWRDETTTLNICPREYGSTVWRIPTKNQYTPYSSRKLELFDPNLIIAKQAVQFLKISATYDNVNGTFCSCKKEAVSTLIDFMGRQNYINYSSEAIPLSELDCRRMAMAKASPHGDLIWNGGGWTTNKTIQPEISSSPLGCCRWIKKEINQCYMYNAPVFQKDPPETMASSGAELENDCEYARGACALSDGRYVIWTPKPHGGTRYPCYLKDSNEPEQGYLARAKTQRDTSLWVASDGSKMIAFNDFDEDIGNKNPIECNTNKRLQGSPVIHTMSSPCFQLINCTNCGTSSLPVPEITEDSISLAQFQELLRSGYQTMMSKAESITTSLREAPNQAMRTLMEIRNITAYAIGPILRLRPCFAISTDSYELLELPQGRELHGFQPLKFLVNKEYYFGYLDVKTQEIMPDINVKSREDDLQRMIATWRDRASLNRNCQTVYRINLWSQNPKSWLPLPESSIPPFVLAGWPRVPPAMYTILNTPVAIQEAHQFMAQLIPLWDPYPLGLQHVVVMILLIYLICVIICLHCCPTFRWIKYFNPCYCVIKTMSSKRKILGRKAMKKMRKIKWMKKYPRNITFQETTFQEVDTRNRRSPSPMRILDPTGSGKMVRVYQCGTGTGKLSATVHIKVNGKTKKSLLDTGSDICLPKTTNSGRNGIDYYRRIRSSGNNYIRRNI